ncbi:hypothetical protein K435DRAFT_879088 [Dendrothele bispora CBS 962.96]|uniref:Heterokaryon incompatibility domain-containing protein n=1 Tax=Dendrothele bispora (strain CBS 962.96) TaxID=1314807 RepID=A0A4V4HAR4_DENBC|nr:hypothetical protein K435DRAFT_879088 [Dendrothele bispora CBS 962.96]
MIISLGKNDREWLSGLGFWSLGLILSLICQSSVRAADGWEEVTFKDIQNLDVAQLKEGWSKIEGACAHPQKSRFDWIWIDSVCDIRLRRVNNKHYVRYHLDKLDLHSSDETLENMQKVIIKEPQAPRPRRPTKTDDNPHGIKVLADRQFEGVTLLSIEKTTITA